MKVIEFIRKYDSIENGLAALTDAFGIKIRRDGKLLVLNYDQIESPKTDPIVVECRSLILEQDTLRVVSRGFDRFFNLGEALDTMPVIDWTRAKVYDKIDGSLIKIYPYKNRWEIATRGTAFADVPCGNWNVTFRELVYRALGVEDDFQFQHICKMSLLMSNTTYIFELTSVENRVVKHYDGYKLHFLASRQNEDGEYNTVTERKWLSSDQCLLKVENPKEYTFYTPEACKDSASSLKDLDEGYVVYQDGVPVCKVKSPAYVAIHHIRGEGLNPKRMAELVLSGEVDEYLTYFPEDKQYLQKYIDAYHMLINSIDAVYYLICVYEDQKEFALKARKHKYSACLFKARAANIDPLKAFDQQRLAYRVEQLQEYLV